MSGCLIDEDVDLYLLLNEECNDVELKLEMLTFRFQRQNFTQFWKYLQRLGWTYDSTNASYRVRITLAQAQFGEGNGINSAIEKGFASAGEVLKFLDLPMIRALHSNLQSTSSTLVANNGYNQHLRDLSYESQEGVPDLVLARYLRRSLLMEMRLNIAQGETQEYERDKKENYNPKVEAEPSVLQETTRHPRRSSRSSSQVQNIVTKNNSITAREKGTAMYLNRKSRKKNKSAKTKDNPELPCLTQAQLSMTLEDCIKFSETLQNSNDEDDDEGDFDIFSLGEATMREEFKEWRFLLSTNHSLLLFGSGSKRQLLTQFAQEELSKEGHILLIDGYDADATMDEILSLLVQLFLNDREPEELPLVPKDDDTDDGIKVQLGRSIPNRNHPLVQRAMMVGRAIAQAIHKADVVGDSADRNEEGAICAVLPVFLVIHNLDAPGFANLVVQDALAALLVNSTVSNHVAAIRLVASVDQIDAPMHLWGNAATAANFSWIYKVAHTHRPYTEEFRLLSEEEKKRSKAPTIAQTLETVRANRVLEVLRNLAPRHAEVVQILAKLQLEEKKKSAWVSYSTFYTQCQRACAVNRETLLRQYLNELNDHGLVVSKVQGSSEYVQIPYDEVKLREIVTYSNKG